MAYTINGVDYTVEFNQVAVGYDISSGSLQATQVTGTVTVNGSPIPMNMTLAPYVL